MHVAVCMVLKISQFVVCSIQHSFTICLKHFNKIMYLNKEQCLPRVEITKTCPPSDPKGKGGHQILRGQNEDKKLSKSETEDV